MENTDEHAQIPNTQNSPTHNTPYHNRLTNNPIHKQSNSIRPHILNTKHNTTNYNTQSHGHEDIKQITKIPKPIHKQQKKTVQNNYTPTATLPNHSTKHYFTLIIQKTTTGTKQSPKIHRKYQTHRQNSIHYTTHKKRAPCDKHLYPQTSNRCMDATA